MLHGRKVLIKITLGLLSKFYYAYSSFYNVSQYFAVLIIMSYFSRLISIRINHFKLNFLPTKLRYKQQVSLANRFRLWVVDFSSSFIAVVNFEDFEEAVVLGNSGR